MEVLSLLGILLVLLLVLGGCYLFTRWAGVGLGGRLGLTHHDHQRRQQGDDRHQQHDVQRLDAVAVYIP